MVAEPSADFGEAGQRIQNPFWHPPALEALYRTLKLYQLFREKLYAGKHSKRGAQVGGSRPPLAYPQRTQALGGPV